MQLMKKCRYGLMIYNKKDIWVGRSFDLYGEYSEAEVQVFRDTVKSGDVAIDVGANTGSHTVALARLVGGGMVLAFEPEKTAYYTLCGNVSINNLRNVVCYQQAVGNRTGTLMVPELDYEQTSNWGGLSLEPDYSKGASYPVNINKIDEMGLGRLDFVKIDIEGMEKDALEGAEKTILQYKPVLYVENDRVEKSEALVSYIKQLGYEMYSHSGPLYNPGNFYENKENVFVTSVEGGVSQFVSVNLYCHHKDVPCLIDTEKFAMTKVQ